MISDQVGALVVGLLIAYATGALRKYGHRVERLCDLAAKLPGGSSIRVAYEAKAMAEAENLWRATTLRPPWVVIIARVLQRIALTALALLGLLYLVGEPIASEVGRWWATLEQQSREPGALPFRVLVINGIIGYSLLPIVLLTGLLLIPRFLLGKMRRWSTPPLRLRHQLVVGCVLSVSIVIYGAFGFAFVQWINNEVIK